MNNEKTEIGCGVAAGGFVGYAKRGTDYRNGPVRATGAEAWADADELACAIGADVERDRVSTLLQEAREALIAAGYSSLAPIVAADPDAIRRVIAMTSAPRSMDREWRAAFRKLCQLYTAITEET